MDSRRYVERDAEVREVLVKERVRRRPNLEELSFRVVLALPMDSRRGVEERRAGMTEVEVDEVEEVEEADTDVR
jgi:hypothetical protein